MKYFVHLIRHGTTEGNVKRWLYGELDIPLTEDGRKLIGGFSEEGIYPRPEKAAYYTSGLKRANETFGIIYKDTARDVIHEFREMCFGIFEGKNHEELENDKEYKHWISDKSGSLSPPEGESVLEFASRVNKGFAKLKEQLGTDAVVVCHGGVISAIMSQEFKGEKKRVFDWIPDPGRGYTLTIENGEATEYKEI